MGLSFSIFKHTSKTDRKLLNRLQVELDMDQLSDSFDVLAERYHRARIRAQASKFAVQKRKYEDCLNADPIGLLRSALKTDGGLENVINSFSAEELESLKSNLDVGCIEIQEEMDPIMPEQPVKKKPNVILA